MRTGVKSLGPRRCKNCSSLTGKCEWCSQSDRQVKDLYRLRGRITELEVERDRLAAENAALCEFADQYELDSDLEPRTRVYQAAHELAEARLRMHRGTLDNPHRDGCCNNPEGHCVQAKAADDAEGAYRAARE